MPCGCSVRRCALAADARIGGGGLKVNQRLVDLNKVQTDAGQKWLAVLDEFATDLDATLALATDQERGVYESLAGPRASAVVRAAPVC